jgi:hypothetical protein
MIYRDVNQLDEVADEAHDNETETHSTACLHELCVDNFN